MNKEYLNTTGSILERIMLISLFLYLFLLIFPHTTTPREIAFWTSTLCWVVLRFKKPESFRALTPIIVSLSLFMVIAFISSAIGMEPLENLKRFKGELLVPFILFLIAATEFSSIERMKLLLSALLIAFAIYTLLAIAESSSYGLRYFWDETNREQYVWLTSYSQIGAVTFPLVLGMFLLVRNTWLKFFLISFAVTEFTILTAYRGFSVFLGVVSVLLLWAIFVKPKKYRLWMLAFICLFLFSFGLLFYTHKDNPAIEEYRATILANPKDFQAHQALAFIYRNQGLYDKSIREYRTVLSLVPWNTEARNNLANIFVVQGRYDEAIREYERILADKPGKTQVYYNLALALERAGRTGEAVYYYRKFLSLGPPGMDKYREAAARRLGELGGGGR